MAMLIGRRTALAAGAAFALASRAQAAEKLRIGAVLYARDSQFWQQIERGMQDAATKYGATLQVVLNRRQLATESQVLDDLATRSIDVLLVSPIDKTASAAAIRHVTATGALSVEYNTFLTDQGISAHTVGVDNTELAASVGRALAAYVTQNLGGTVKLGVVTLPPINPGSAVRKAGFLGALGGIKYTVTAETSGATPEEGANAFETILQRDPATQLVWCSSAGTIEGAAASARRAGSAVRLFGIDMSKTLAEAMLDPKGSVEAVSDQQPYRVGYLAVETAVKAKQGEQMPRAVTVPARLYSRQDVAGLHEYLDLLKSLQG